VERVGQHDRDRGQTRCCVEAEGRSVIVRHGR
jgi:hypothetical protein